MRSWSGLALILAAGAVEAEPSEEVLAACHSVLPGSMAENVEPGATEGSGDAGSWRIESADLGGIEGEEAIVVILPANKPGEVRFVGAREGKSPLEKKISFKGSKFTQASVAFPVFREGASLAHVKAGDGGTVLLYWDGKKLSTIWKVGKPSQDESRWIELEDLDADGVAEVIVYHRRALDVYTDEDELDFGGGGSEAASGKVDAVEVYRLRSGSWKKDKDLLENLR